MCIGKNGAPASRVPTRDVGYARPADGQFFLGVRRFAGPEPPQRAAVSPAERLLQLFGEAEALEPAARAAFLDELRATDASLAEELASLLEASDRSDRDAGILDASAWRSLGDTLARSEPSAAELEAALPRDDRPVSHRAADRRRGHGPRLSRRATDRGLPPLGGAQGDRPDARRRDRAPLPLRGAHPRRPGAPRDRPLPRRRPLAGRDLVSRPRIRRGRGPVGARAQPSAERRRAPAAPPRRARGRGVRAFPWRGAP